MRQVVVCALAATLSALALFSSAPRVAAKPKPPEPFLKFRWSDDPRPGFEASYPVSRTLARRDGQPVVRLAVTYNLILEGANGAPYLFFAIPALPWAAQTYPLEVSAADVTWRLGQFSTPEKVWRPGASTGLSVSLTGFDAKRNALTGTFSFTGLEDATPDHVLQPVNVAGSFLVSPPVDPAAAPKPAPYFTRTTSHDAGLVEVTPLDKFAASSTKTSLQIRHATVFPRTGTEDAPSFAFEIALPGKVSKLMLPMQFTPTTVGIGFGHNADVFDSYAESPEFTGFYTQKGAGTLTVVLESYDRKRKLVTGTYSFTGLTSKLPRPSFATLDCSGTFVVPAK